MIKNSCYKKDHAFKWNWDFVFSANRICLLSKVNISILVFFTSKFLVQHSHKQQTNKRTFFYITNSFTHWWLLSSNKQKRVHAVTSAFLNLSLILLDSDGIFFVWLQLKHISKSFWNIWLTVINISHGLYKSSRPKTVILPLMTLIFNLSTTSDS